MKTLALPALTFQYGLGYRKRLLDTKMSKLLCIALAFAYICLCKKLYTMHIHNLRPVVVAAATLFLTFSALRAAAKGDDVFSPVGFANVSVSGELNSRVLRNMERLESERYQPGNVFLTEEQSGYWPGDTEGRTILGLVMDAQASGREPQYLSEIIRLIPEHLNSRGYFGTIHRDSLDEQQLSGNGWVLRALCEYYLWKHDKSVLPVIRSISENLFADGRELLALYPIDPAGRTATGGGASGSLGETIGRWRLSTDIGCVFIGMDGLIQAYETTHNRKLKPVIDELVNLFLKVDLTGIKAQTHASLTALRGLIRYAGITGNDTLIAEVEKRWKLYKQFGMTENYANYNWFCRYDTWTEPCAIVDSYIVAAQLWQHTGKPEYRNDAELIYYNAICHGQRANGGFGTDKCPGTGSGSPCVAVSDYEAWWCCTMRGGEGLGRAVEYTAFRRGNEVALPFYRNAMVKVPFGKKDTLAFRETTSYPFDSRVDIHISSAPRREVKLSFAYAEWMENFKITLNCNHEITPDTANGMASVSMKFNAGDRLSITFSMKPRTVSTLNADNTGSGSFRVLCGPLLLTAHDACTTGFASTTKFEPLGGNMFRVEGTSVVLSPLYHLMEQKVNKDAQPPYARRVVF